MSKRAIKIALTLVLVGALGFLVDWNLVLHTVLQARPEWLIAAAACVVMARIVITLRWRCILQAAGQSMNFRRLFRVVSAGIGLGSLLPTSVGPDLARGVLLHTDAADGEERIGTGLLVSSLVFDRYAATLGTLLVAGVGAAGIGLFSVAAVLGLVFVLAVALTVALVRYSAPLIHAITPGPLRKLAPKLEAMADYMRKPHMVWRGLLPATLISGLLAVVRVGVFLSLYKAFGHSVPIPLALFIIPAMLIALMAPVTVGGFGLREWLLAVGFADAGVPAEVSVSVGLLAFAVQIVVSLPAIAHILIAKRKFPATGRLRKEKTS